ncbi:MAG: hypothetical protein QOH70_608 [Blastocatellia bacterium]|nr:hypothetical protein [Blastocatellia bacterium]
MADQPNINHNVYILGAGFSADGGVPVVSNFLERMADSMDWLSSEGRTREAEAVQSVFSFRLRAAGAAYRAQIDVENIEELFSLASASESRRFTKDITTAIAATIDFARCTSSVSECVVGKKVVVGNGWKREDETIPTYQLYAGMISSQMCRGSSETKNSVITFNYDTLLEDALADLQIEFSYGLPTAAAEYRDSGKSTPPPAAPPLGIFKLHGSVNWGTLAKSNSKIRIYPNYRSVPANERLLLVPPTWRKVFGGQLGAVWEHSVKALTEATRIVVIGFSMRPTDAHFKYLLAAGLQNNISLRKFLFVNPGLQLGGEEAKLRSNLYTILREELEDRGIVELLPIRADELFFSGKYAGTICRYRDPNFLDIRYPGKEMFLIHT